MNRYSIGRIIILLATLVPLAASAQTFVIGDSSTKIVDPVGIAAGNSISFQGNINVPNDNAVELGPLPAGVMIAFEAGSNTFSGAAGNDAVNISGIFGGSFSNFGTITSLTDDGVDFERHFEGNFLNTGTINGDNSGVNFGRIMRGRFVNTGTITGGDQGVDIDRNLNGSFVNTGTIIGIVESGVEIEGNLSGSFVNTGTITGQGEEGVDIFGALSGSFLNQGSITGKGLEGVYIARIADDGTFMNEGSISGEFEGVYIDRNINGLFNNSGSITGNLSDGVNMRNLDGTLINSGTIKSTQSDGVYMDRDINGLLDNSGQIVGGGFHGLHVGRDLSGKVNNTGSILGQEVGILVDREMNGTIFNCGIIQGTDLVGIDIFRTTGTIINDGGRIQGGNNAIRLGRGDGTLILSGPSHIVGNIRGNGGSDTLRFENMRGISAAKKAELVALANADSRDQTDITLFGETLSWISFEDIQIDGDTLVSYESLITGAGLQSYAMALDNVIGLNDDFREFLKELNKIDASLLNEIAANSSGQTLINGLDDFARNQDSRNFSLLAAEFSTLRGEVSGTEQAPPGEPSGLLAREVPVGATVTPIDDTTHSFVSGYVGRGTQSRSLTRQKSSYDNTSIIYGASKEITNEWNVGIFGGYTDNESAVDSFGSLLKNEAAYFGVTAQYTTDYFFANFVAAYGFHDQESIRRDFFGNTMEGDTTGSQGLLYSQVGRDLYLGEEGNAKITPYLGFAVSSLSMGDYTEVGPATTSLRFADDSTTSVQTVLGINASCFKETSYGWVKPRIDAAWWHEYTEAGRYGVSLASPGLLNSFNVFSPSANRNRGIIQIGTEIGFDAWENVSFDLGYFVTTGEDGFTAHGGSLGATFKF